jgi:hypothetical protein
MGGAQRVRFGHSVVFARQFEVTKACFNVSGNPSRARAGNAHAMS